MPEKKRSPLSSSRDNYSLERGARTLAQCGRPGEAAPIVRELRDRFPIATLTIRVSVPVAEAAEALGRNDPRRALQLLEPVKPYDRASRAAFWPEYLRGQAFLALKEFDNASAQFTSILDRRGEDPSSSIYPLARLWLARTQVQAGDAGKARLSYQAFLSSLPEADQDLKPIIEARQELARVK